MINIYTKTGDEGMTGLLGGRVSKNDARVEAYGAIDEMNAFIGLTIPFLDDEQDADIRQDLQTIQHTLFLCCADLATLDPHRRSYQVNEHHVEALETLIDGYCGQTTPLEHFILPGGSRAAATLHVCRTITRRAERRVITLEQQENSVNLVVKKLLNRLSDLFFVLARVCNARADVADVQYIQGERVFRSGGAPP